LPLLVTLIASAAAIVALACGSDAPLGSTPAPAEDAGTEREAGRARSCTRGAQHRVSNAPGESIKPHLAAGPGGAAVAWQDTRGGGEDSRVYFATLDPNATPSAEVLVPWTIGTRSAEAPSPGLHDRARGDRERLRRAVDDRHRRQRGG
jgi:hypothetical protein